MKALRSVCALALAALVLVSSTSFVVGMHFCSGELESIAFLSEAAACEKERTLPPCHHHTTATCCDDETILHEGSDFKSLMLDLALSAPAIESAEPPVLIAEIIPATSAAHPAPDIYDPPLRSTDLTVNFQVFLI